MWEAHYLSPEPSNSTTGLHRLTKKHAPPPPRVPCPGGRSQRCKQTCEQERGGKQQRAAAADITPTFPSKKTTTHTIKKLSHSLLGLYSFFLLFFISDHLHFILNLADSSPISMMLIFFHYYFTSQLISFFGGDVGYQTQVCVHVRQALHH